MRAASQADLCQPALFQGVPLVTEGLAAHHLVPEQLHVAWRPLIHSCFIQCLVVRR